MMKKKHKYLSDLGNTNKKVQQYFINYLKNQLTKKKVIRTLNISLFSKRVSAKQKQIQLNVQ